jgi:thrombospondin type 3 repeat protein
MAPFMGTAALGTVPMRVRSALVLAALLATVALAPLAAPAGIPANGGAATLYFRSLQAPLPGLGAVETLSDEVPVNTNNTIREVTDGAAWFAVPGASREFSVGGSVAGATAFQVEASAVPLLGVTFDNTVTFSLLKVATNGSALEVGNATQNFQATVGGGILGPSVPVSAAVPVSFDIATTNLTLLPGETLGINITGTSQVPAGPGSGVPTSGVTGTLQMLYDSTLQPGALNLTLTPILRGQIQASSSTLAREGAPGCANCPTYTVTVRNVANEADTAQFNVTGAPADWRVTLTPASMPLSAGASGSLLVTVAVPQGAADGTRHTTTLVVTSANGAPAQTLTLTTTARAGATQPGPGGATDTDGDGWSDVDEVKYSSNPRDRLATPVNTDSDGDGYDNRDEVDGGTDPFDARSFPGSGNGGGNSAASAGLFGPLSDQVAQALGTDRATADLAVVGLILLFIIILLLLYLLLRGYPVKVSLVQARATTSPGQAVDYTVELRSLRRQPQVVDLEVGELPQDWDARLSQPRVNLDPKGIHSVGLLVRPPVGWPAPSKRDFVVRARSRLKPSKAAKASGKLAIQPGGPPPEPPGEVGVREPAAFPQDAPAAAYAPPPASARAGGPFRIAISQVKHAPEVPERGGEVTTVARVDNQGSNPERVRLLLVVNGKVRDEVNADLGPGEGAEAEFHWVAHLARNEVRVVAERA